MENGGSSLPPPLVSISNYSPNVSVSSWSYHTEACGCDGSSGWTSFCRIETSRVQRRGVKSQRRSFPGGITSGHESEGNLSKLTTRVASATMSMLAYPPGGAGGTPPPPACCCFAHRRLLFRAHDHRLAAHLRPPPPQRGGGPQRSAQARAQCRPVLEASSPQVVAVGFGGEQQRLQCVRDATALLDDVRVATALS